MDEAIQLQIVEEILQLFLFDKSKIESIILFTQRIHYNSACTNASTLKNKNNNMRITRIMGKASASLPLQTSHKQLSSRDLIKNKKKEIKISKKED